MGIKHVFLSCSPSGIYEVKKGTEDNIKKYFVEFRNKRAIYRGDPQTFLEAAKLAIHLIEQDLRLAGKERKEDETNDKH